MIQILSIKMSITRNISHSCNYLYLMWLLLCSLDITFCLMLSPNTSHDSGDFNNQPTKYELSHSAPDVPSLSPCAQVTENKELTIDCRSLQLTGVLPTWFPQKTMSILLDSNQLTSVPATFDHLRHLRRLSLSYNSITDLQANTFSGLGQLEYLNLDYNPLKIYHISNDTFASLENLTELSMQQDVELPITPYPIEAFSSILNLKSLTVSVDCETLQFGKDFRNITTFSELNLRGNIRALTRDSFINLGNLKQLDLSIIRTIKEIDTGVFQSLKNLNQLYISNLRVQLKVVLASLSGLVGQTMDTIALGYIRFFVKDRYSNILQGDGILSRKHTKYLTQICVAHVALTYCKLYIILDKAVTSKTWDRCLKSLDLTDNPIMGTKIVVLHLLKMSNLETLIIHDSSKPQAAKNSLLKTDYGNMCRTSNPTQNNNYNYNLNDSSYMFTSNISNGYKIYISKSLRCLNFGNLITEFSIESNGTFVYADNLVYLDVSDGGGSMFTHHLHGLTNIKAFILSGSELTVINRTFFDTMPSLETLDLSSCKLSGQFMAESGGRLFQNLQYLKQLDLSFNQLAFLSPEIFYNNVNLKELFLAGNRFRKIPFSLKNTPRLSVLDMRFNELTRLPVEIRNNLDQIFKENKEFSFYLEGNVLSCGCHDIQFLQWIQLTAVNMDMFRNYSCVDNDGVLTYTAAFSDLQIYWRQCWGTVFLYLSMILFCLLIIGFVLCFFVTKYKTYIISGLLNLFSETFLKKPSNYEIGVFIGYADRDYQFACHDLRQFIEDTLGLTTFIRDRDLSISTDLASATVLAIDRSWRVLLVVNETFLSRDRWFLFMCRAATSALTSANPKRIVVLVEDQLRHRLPAELSRVVLEDNIVVTRGNFLDYELKEKLRTRLLE
ncbi:toll-like receptor 4 [Physella acuta]|uniref:toll-like receptor 4 n=1 Tax=Physella acuta TaxID=109671 RepID=UPI0027DBF017|nr:toll-like receptor 4 [Physella acuta]